MATRTRERSTDIALHEPMRSMILSVAIKQINFLLSEHPCADAWKKCPLLTGRFVPGGLDRGLGNDIWWKSIHWKSDQSGDWLQCLPRGNNHKNNLWAYAARLYEDGCMAAQQFGKVGRVLTNYHDCYHAVKNVKAQKRDITRYEHNELMLLKIPARRIPIDYISIDCQLIINWSSIDGISIDCQSIVYQLTVYWSYTD